MIKNEIYKALKKEVPNLSLMGIDQFTNEELESIIQAFKESRFLRINIKSLYWIRDHYDKVITGYYKDFQNPAYMTQEEFNERFENIEALFTHYTDEDK